MHEDIRIALTKLHQDNKTPTLALLKNRLGRSFPMPELIAALTEWKRDPRPADLSKLASPQPEKATRQQEATVEALQQQVVGLKAELALVVARLEKLERVQQQ